jgi:hypothetical protein
VDPERREGGEVGRDAGGAARRRGAGTRGPTAGVRPAGISKERRQTGVGAGGVTPATAISNIAAVTTQWLRTDAQIELLTLAQPDAAITTSVPASASIAQCHDGSNQAITAGKPRLADGDELPGDAPLPLVAATTFHRGDPIFIRVVDRDQNLHPRRRDSVIVTATSDTGDEERVVLTETGVNTGEFLGFVQTAAPPVVVGDCLLSVAPGARINVRYVDPVDNTDITQLGALVDPLGRVFDSTTGAMIDGARITLIDADVNAPAIVFGDDAESLGECVQARAVGVDPVEV